MPPSSVIIIMGKKFMASKQLDLFEDKHRYKRGSALAQCPVSWVPPNICVGRKEANTPPGPGFPISAHVFWDHTPGCMQTNNERMLWSVRLINQILCGFLLAVCVLTQVFWVLWLWTKNKLKSELKMITFSFLGISMKLFSLQY